MLTEICKTYTISEAAELMGIGLNQAYDAAHAGQIPSIRVGRRLLVPKKRLDQLLDGSESPEASPATGLSVSG